MTEPIILIVNADDIGYSPGVNRGIMQAHEQGIVTSTSLMVRGLAVESAAEYCRAHPRLSVGLHIDLGEWIYRNGEWLPLYSVVPLDDVQRVQAEIERQLDLFRTLLLREPSHIDSHQHVHRSGAAQSAALKVAKELRIPLRHHGSVRYCGHFYGQPMPGESHKDSVSAEALVQIIRTLDAGITELACHPGIGQDHTSDYSQERNWETESLCDPQVRAAIESRAVQLSSFDSPVLRSRCV